MSRVNSRLSSVGAKSIKSSMGSVLGFGVSRLASHSLDKDKCILTCQR